MGIVKWLLIAVAALLGMMLVGIFAFSPTAPEAQASEEARRDIPQDMLVLYQEAAETCPGLDWSVLAAVGKVETDHARNVRRSSAGAEGPMQFTPGTWNGFRVDGDEDGAAEVQDPVDAVYSAANYLCANGAGNPATLDAALFRYNHSEAYVRKVRQIASQYATYDSLRIDGVPTAAELISIPGLTFTSRAEADLLQNRVDSRLMLLLGELSKRHSIAVSVFKSGHSRCVGGIDRPGCHVSNHFYGRGMDIYMVDGELVTASNSSARAVSLWLYELDEEIRPSEIGTPFPLTAGPLFTDEDHRDHIHVGFRK